DFMMAGAIATMQKYVPARLTGLARRLLLLPSQFAHRRGLSKIPFVLSTGEPKLNYGGVLNSRKSDLIHGGKVKLVHLQESFPEGESSFNLLYLVSSALPKHAID